MMYFCDGGLPDWVSGYRPELLPVRSRRRTASAPRRTEQRSRHRRAFATAGRSSSQSSTRASPCGCASSSGTATAGMCPAAASGSEVKVLSRMSPRSHPSRRDRRPHRRRAKPGQPAMSCSRTFARSASHFRAVRGRRPTHLLPWVCLRSATIAAIIVDENRAV